MADLFIGLFLGILLSAPVPVFAAFSNYNSVLLGERAAGMGGAFTALTGDPAATPFYNPATTILMPGTNLSAAVSVYNKYAINYGEENQAGGVPQQVNQGFFRSLPTSSGTILNFGSFAAGLSIVKPDYEFFSGQVQGTDTINSTLNYTDESLWVGPTFSARLTDRDRIGLTLYYTSRDLTRTISDRLTTGGGTGATITIEEKDLTANAIVSVLGYQRQLTDTWAVGISYRPPSLPIGSEASFYESTTQTTPYSTTVINQGGVSAVAKIPSRIAIGVAREVKGVNTLSADIQVYEGLSYQDVSLPAGAEQENYNQVWNFAVGYEQIVADWLTLRLGVYSNRSSHPEPTLESGLRQGDHLDMNGFSTNVKLRLPSGTSFTIGGYYTAGDGQATEFTGGKLVLVPKSEQVFTMLVATGFQF